MSKTTFSLIGAGRMGQNHLKVSQNLGLEIKAIYDVNKESLDTISRLLKSDALLTDRFDEFMHISATDITTIATTSPSHAGLIEALAQGERKTIICEKPLATSTLELKQISELARRFDLRIAVNHQMRFMDQYRIVRRLQQEHRLGDLCTMSVNGANFGLGMNATHYIEAFHWLSRTEISSVSGNVRRQQSPNVRGAEFYDYAGHMLVQNDTGSLLFLDFQEKIAHHVLVIYNFEFGKICVNELSGTVSLDSRLDTDLSEPSFKYGLTNQHLEVKINPAELVESTSYLYKQLMLGDDYPSHLDGERTVRAALAAILSTGLGSVPVKLNDQRLDEMRDLTWP
jgi:predicted dehydrogenase